MLNAFKEKLHLWCRQVKRGNLSNFPSLEEVTDEHKSLIPGVRKENMNDLEILSTLFDGSFRAGELKISEQ